MTGPVSTPAFCTQCRSRCGCVAVTEGDRLLRIEPDPSHPTGARLCPKGRAAPELVHHQDRLATPLRRVSPKGAPAEFRPISWDEALDEIGAALARIRGEAGPEAVAFGVTTPSGTHMSDGIAWVERLIRAFGSPNTIYATEICNWHKDVAARFTYGWDIGTPDFARTGLAMLWGWNPSATWLARSGEILEAQRRGAKLLVVDPRPTLHAKRADLWLRVRPGTDQALALSIAHLLLSTGRFDEGFLRRRTSAALLVGADGRFLREGAHLLAADEAGGRLRYDPAAGEWLDPPERAALVFRGKAAESALARFAAAAAEWEPERAARETGVPAAEIEAAAALIAAAPRVAYYAWNGVGQSVTATQTDRAISLLYALTGSYGAEGGNVPGGAAAFNDISGQELLSAAQRAKALGAAARPLGPPKQGWVRPGDVWRAALGEGPYRVRALVSFGGNLLASQPDPELARRGLAALDLHVHADFFLNATAREADIVLPAATSWEREGLRAGFDGSLDGLRRVQFRPAVIPPVGEARSDIDIALGLAARLGLSEAMFSGDAEAGHAHMLAPSGVTLDDLRARPEGVTLPGAARLKPYEAGGFPTPTRLLEIWSEPLAAAVGQGVPTLDAAALPQPEPGYPLRLGGAKTVAYCHSQGRNLASLRRLEPDPPLDMAPETAAARGLAAGDWAEVRTRAGAFRARVRLVAGLEPGCVFAQHGWAVGDDPLVSSLNAATSAEPADPVSGSAPLRASWCEVARVE